MNGEILPTHYYLEIYEEDYNDLIVSYESTTPFQNFNKGDVFEHRNMKLFQKVEYETEQLIISEVKHILWKVENDHIGHKIMIILKKEKKT